MTNEQLQAIEARVAETTPGPWEVRRIDMCGCGGIPAYYNVFMSMRDRFIPQQIPNLTKGNATFIAHSRQDIPELVAEVKRLQAELASLKDIVFQGALRILRKEDLGIFTKQRT